MKTFRFRIENDDFIKEIKIDANRIKNLNELNAEISKQFKLDINQFEFENPPTKEIKEYENGYKFRLKLKGTSSELNFQLPDRKNHIQFKNSKKLTFKSIKDQIKQDKTHFYSPLCVENNFSYYLFGMEILYKDVKNNFINLPPNKSYEIKLKGKYVELEVYDKRFTFSENEKIHDVSIFSENKKKSDVSSFIKEKFGISSAESYVEILRDSQSGKRFLGPDDFLQKGDVFKSLLINVCFQFDYNSERISHIKKFDIYTTIENVLRFSAIIYSSNVSLLKAEDIVLLFVNRKTKKNENITNLQSKLIDFYDGKGIEFHIDIITGKSAQQNDNQYKKKEQCATYGRLVFPNETPQNTKTQNVKKETTKLLETKKETTKPQETKKETKNEIRVFFNCTNGQNFQMKFSPNKTIADVVPSVQERASIHEKLVFMFNDNCKNVINQSLKFDCIKEKMYDNKHKIYILCVDTESNYNKQMTKEKNKTEEKPKDKLTLISPEKPNDKTTIKSPEKPNDKTTIKSPEKPNDKTTIKSPEKPNDKTAIISPEKPKEKPKDLKERNIQPSSRKLKYWYQNLNESDIINEIELDPTATVKTLKMEIKKKYKVKNIYDIKVLFAGKDLLDDIILEKLNLGSTILFVYIRTPEDILLMTAKALRIESEIEEEVSDD